MELKNWCKGSEKRARLARQEAAHKSPKCGCLPARDVFEVLGVEVLPYRSRAGEHGFQLQWELAWDTGSALIVEYLFPWHRSDWISVRAWGKINTWGIDTDTLEIRAAPQRVQVDVSNPKYPDVRSVAIDDNSS